MEVWDHGWFLYPTVLINESYCSYEINEDVYALHQAYFERNEQKGGNKNVGDQLTISNWMEGIYTQTIKNLFVSNNPCLMHSNILGKRKSRKDEFEQDIHNTPISSIDFVSWCNMYLSMESKFGQTKEYSSYALDIVDLSDSDNENLICSMDLDSLFHQVYINSGKVDVLLKICKKEFIFPPNSSFMICDYQKIDILQEYG